MSLSVGSLQTGEGAKIYEYTGTSLSSLNLSDLTLLDTFVGEPVTQTATNVDYKYLVVEGYDSTGKLPDANSLVSQEVIDPAPAPAPEADLGVAAFVMVVGAASLARRRRS